MNIIGLNESPISAYQNLNKKYKLIAFQETKFSASKKIARADYFVRTVDFQAKTFWSPIDSINRKGQNGVGLILFSGHLFDTIADISDEIIPTYMQSRYIILDTKIEKTRIMIHIIYAPVQTQNRKEFFNFLPSEYPEEVPHIILGDFNVPMNPTMDSIINTTTTD